MVERLSELSGEQKGMYNTTGECDERMRSVTKVNAVMHTRRGYFKGVIVSAMDMINEAKINFSSHKAQDRKMRYAVTKRTRTCNHTSLYFHNGPQIRYN